jgi:four helix bundle protein
VRKINSYRELDVWQQARELVKYIYQLTSKFPSEEKYGLINQLRRAAISVPSNIAEGCGRNHPRDSIQFYFVARGSLYEVETQLILASDLQIISHNDLEQALEKLTRCKKLLNGFINYFETQANNKQRTTTNDTSNEHPTTINEILETYGNSNTN